MKPQYSLLVSLLALAGTTTMQAQSTMQITKTDGTTLSIAVEDIAEVAFPSDDALLITLPYRTYWLHPGQWFRLTADCTTFHGQTVSTKVTWKTSDPSVAIVDAQGNVVAIDDGLCTITAEAEGSEASLTVHVSSQEAIDIQVGEVGNRHATYTVTPTDSNLRYYYNIRIQSGEYSVDGMTQFGSEEQNMLHFTRDWWDFCGELYGISWTEFMNQYGLVTGPHTETEEDMKPGEQYCIYAMAFDETGELASPVEVKKLTTGVPSQSDITFQVTMDQILSNDATFTIIPSTHDPYFVNVQRASYVEWFVENDKMPDMVTSLVGTITPALYPEAYCQGTVTRSMSDYLETIRSDSDYYVIVFGFDEGQTSPISLTKFHTTR